MDNLIYILFVCMALPLLLSLALMEKKSRLIVGFIIIGAFLCVFVSEINGIILRVSDQSVFYISTNLTPLTEEFIKALPVLLFAYAYSDDRDTLITLAMAVGIGFAILENIYIFVSSGSAYNLFWAFRRVLGASLMHGLCTSLVGYGISFVRKRRKLFYTGTFALLLTAMVYHSLYNSLICSDVEKFAFLLPVVTYIPIILYIHKLRKPEKAAQGEK